jgi:hypothetical protein
VLGFLVRPLAGAAGGAAGVVAGAVDTRPRVDAARNRGTHGLSYSGS